MAGTVYDGPAEPTRREEWSRACVPIRDARPRAGACWRRGPLGLQAHPVGHLVFGSLEVFVPPVQQRGA
eukprot:9545397-Alexandrium_andersonii.AAC.1